MRKRIEEQLRSAALSTTESAFGGHYSTSDLSELLQTFKCSASADILLSKGTHFSHTQKFTFTRVRSIPQLNAKIHFHSACRVDCSLQCLLYVVVWCVQDVTEVTSAISTGHQSESDIQIHQQEVLATLQQQVQQLCSDVDQLTVDMKHMSVNYTQVMLI